MWEYVYPSWITLHQLARYHPLVVPLCNAVGEWNICTCTICTCMYIVHTHSLSHTCTLWFWEYFHNCPRCNWLHEVHKTCSSCLHLESAFVIEISSFLTSPTAAWWNYTWLVDSNNCMSLQQWVHCPLISPADGFWGGGGGRDSRWRDGKTLL